MNELVRQISQRACIDARQADLALGVVIEFLARRLSSPAVGEIRMLVARETGADPAFARVGDGALQTDTIAPLEPQWR